MAYRESALAELLLGPSDLVVRLADIARTDVAARDLFYLRLEGNDLAYVAKYSAPPAVRCSRVAGSRGGVAQDFAQLDKAA
jgi:hypothetical protein